MSEMKKTPSYLKGLAETRARLAGDVERHERLLGEISEKLGQARRELEACDLLIRRFDGRLDPQKIAPIRPWRYSKKRGVLRDAIVAILKDSAPNPLTTHEIGWELQIRLALSFETPIEYSKWLHGSVARQLKCFVVEERVERLHDPLTPTSEVGRWRWKSDIAPSLTDLTERLAFQGAAVRSCDIDPVC
jgi:hypothetical protein